MKKNKGIIVILTIIITCLLTIIGVGNFHAKENSKIDASRTSVNDSTEINTSENTVFIASGNSNHKQCKVINNNVSNDANSMDSSGNSGEETIYENFDSDSNVTVEGVEYN